MTVRLEILGPLRVRRGDTELDAGPHQQRCLLALLLAREGRPVSMNELIALLWGPDSPASATNIIQKYVGASSVVHLSDGEAAAREELHLSVQPQLAMVGRAGVRSHDQWWPTINAERAIEQHRQRGAICS